MVLKHMDFKLGIALKHIGVKQRYLFTRGNRLRLRYAAPLCLAFAVSIFSFSDARSSLSFIEKNNGTVTQHIPVEEQVAMMRALGANNKGKNSAKVAEEAKPKPLEPKTVALKIKKGDTLAGILQSNGIAGTEAYHIVNAIGEHYDPRKLRAGQAIDVRFNPDKETRSHYEFAGLSMRLDALRDIKVRPDAKAENAQEIVMHAELVEKKTEIKTRAARTAIQTSIFGSASEAGIPSAVIAEMIRVYSWSVDFQRDIRSGDTIELLYEAHETKDGEVVKYGNLLYANLSVNGRAQPMYRFEMKDGTTDYFDPEGMSIRKTLMKTPIDGARLSSGFGMRRHPVLGYNKMHKGTDFAAPTGTPIYAAGDGTVVERGRKGGYGNYMRIRHNNELSTAYAHMHKFNSKATKGARVTQGQIIGYVGTTGRSTGPHLHYEVLKNNRQVNPRSINLPVGIQLAGADKDKFKSVVKTAQREYASLSRGLKFAGKVFGRENVQ